MVFQSLTFKKNIVMFHISLEKNQKTSYNIKWNRYILKLCLLIRRDIMDNNMVSFEENYIFRNNRSILKQQKDIP